MRATAAAAFVAATLGAPLALAQATADAGAASATDSGTASAPASSSATETASASAPATDAHELPPEEPKAPKKKALPVPLSIMGGLRIGAILPAGDVGQSPQLPVAITTAVDLTLEAGATIYEHFYGGLLFGGSFYISPASSARNVNAILFGTEVGYLTNPDGLGGFFGLGLGYRRYFIGDALSNANTVDGPDALATIALHIRAGSAMRILPRFDFAVGPAGGYTHALFFFGASIWFNQDLARAPH